MTTITAKYYFMPHCAKCAGRKELTQKVCDSKGIELEMVDVTKVKRSAELEALGLHNLPTLRLSNDTELYGAYSMGDLEKFLDKELT